jgi:tight adherence protein B
MLPILAAVLAFITIGGLGWAFVGGGDSSQAAIKRAQNFGGPKQNTARNRSAPSARPASASPPS